MTIVDSAKEADSQEPHLIEVSGKSTPHDDFESLERQIAIKCTEMLDLAQRRAKEIIEGAARQTEERNRREAAVLRDLAVQIAGMGEAYRSAMTAARQAIDHLVGLLEANGVSLQGPDQGQDH